MSDKENVDNTQSRPDSEASSNKSEISKTAKSIVKSTIEMAINKINARVDLERENETLLYQTNMIDDITDEFKPNFKNVVITEELNNKMRSTTSILEDDFNDKNIQISGQYDSSEQEAFLLVDKALNNAIRRLEDESKENLNKIDGNSKNQKLHLANEKISVANIQWPSIATFTEQLGERKINEFVILWRLGEDWLHCIDYLGFLETRFDKRHRYRVRFSIPTSRHPIPVASASVYFTIVASKIKPPHRIVDVLYVVESSHLIHRPGEYIFCELWLRRIIDHKYALIKFFDF